MFIKYFTCLKILLYYCQKGELLMTTKKDKNLESFNNRIQLIVSVFELHL